MFLVFPSSAVADDQQNFSCNENLQAVQFITLSFTFNVQWVPCKWTWAIVLWTQNSKDSDLDYVSRLATYVHGREVGDLFWAKMSYLNKITMLDGNCG